MKFLRNLFKRKAKFVILEVLDRDLRPITGDDEAAIASLAGHPGFSALVRKFRLQAAVLENQLRTKRPKDLREVDALQIGLYWLNYAQVECDKTIYKKELPAPAIQVDDLEMFKKIYASIERVE